MDSAGVVLLFGLIFWVVVATLVGGLVGSRKGRGGLGALLGFLLGWIGVLIIALMKPSPDFEKQQAAAQAQVLREALGGGIVESTPAASSGVVITPEVRQELLAEAIRRDPSLAASSDPETLKRLGDTMEALEKEYTLKAELDQLKANQEAASQAAEEAERNRKIAEERALAAAAVEAANQLEAERKTEQRATEIAAMGPLRRFIATRPAVTGTIAVLVVLGVGTAIAAPIRAKASAEAAARRTTCEEDINVKESLIDTVWEQMDGVSGMTFTAGCTMTHPSNTFNFLPTQASWQRVGPIVTIKFPGDGGQLTFRVDEENLRLVSIKSNLFGGSRKSTDNWTFTQTTS